ncbi:MAG: CDP-glycerol glycerophosphotransferase family protein [Anaerovoracaceae bacterium]
MNPLKILTAKYRAGSRYLKYRREAVVSRRRILLESQHGREIDGNIFYILRELLTNEAYRDFEIFLTVGRREQIPQFRRKIRPLPAERVRFVEIRTREYYRVISSAGFLINDNTFLPFFIKKEGQVYLNLWHGTPLKTLGRRISGEPQSIGNTQKNFVAADYLLYPNEYTRDHMIEDYMIANLSSAKILLCGYPRNAAFFDAARRAEIRRRCGFDGRKVYAYMPTWRGVIGTADQEADAQLAAMLRQLDRLLRKDERLFVKLHPAARSVIDLSGFERIEPFPEEYETYEFIDAADCLVTDYSSVMYDYAVTGKKIVLFVFDEEAYLARRGLYEPLESLPFERVRTPEALLASLRSGEQPALDAFQARFCRYDRPDAAAAICARVILGKQEVIEQEMPSNGRENILLYGGSLDRNGITSSLLNLLHRVDTRRYNYFITFSPDFNPDNADVLRQLPEGVGYFAPCSRRSSATIPQKTLITLYRKGTVPFRALRRFAGEVYRQEPERLFAKARFRWAIQFCGYGVKPILYFLDFPCRSAIYVHSDMKQEIATRKLQKKAVLQYAYPRYDRIAVVSASLIAPTRELAGRSDNICLCRNLIDDEAIREKAARRLEFDPYTVCSTEPERVRRILDSEAPKIINIARFAPEKGQRRLIDAFEQNWRENRDIYLILLGGNQFGNTYEQLKKYAAEKPCADHIILIMNMSNPYPLIKNCDYSVLSSFYEGFGLVLLEADILGLPTVSTDIAGPGDLLRAAGGRIVENNEQGISEGIRALLHREVGLLDIDYRRYNEEAVREFETLLS